jgi:hypothetical protein
MDEGRECNMSTKSYNGNIRDKAELLEIAFKEEMRRLRDEGLSEDIYYIIDQAFKQTEVDIVYNDRFQFLAVHRALVDLLQDNEMLRNHVTMENMNSRLSPNTNLLRVSLKAIQEDCAIGKRIKAAERLAERLEKLLDSCACGHGERVAIYDSNMHGWYAVDLYDAETLADRLEDCESIGDTYSLWCSETASERVEVES